MTRSLWLAVPAILVFGWRVSADDSPISPVDRDFWAFCAVQNPRVPDVRRVDFASGPIDRFVLSSLEARGLSPATAADKRTLLRRATFDLHGLPPSTEEIEAFLSDPSVDAFARVVERLLASPRYGERWGRRWLDLARYADSNGMDENMAMAQAWRYRDYVVKAFNDDLPYDQFLREQLAGDLLPADDETARYQRLIATGFLILGPKMLAEDDPVKMEMDIIDEQVDTIGRAFLGLTLGCARCHDHKFDPISTSDYYSLAGIFKSTKSMENHRVVAMWSERPLAREEEVARLRAHEKRIAELTEVIKSRRESASKDELATLEAELAELNKTKPDVPHALAVAEQTACDLPIHVRGSHLSLGPVVPRRFPRVLAGDDQRPIGERSSGRLELAQWLTRPDHPLTSRVMVNRIWQGHFGEGLVRSPDNFGLLGEPPDNQALLDYLARQFVASGWSIKAMHRLLMQSSAYRMSAVHNEAAARVDPENRLLWRMNRRRLDAEEIRDAMLLVSGLVDFSMGGTLLPYKNHTYVTSTGAHHHVDYENNRRSVYLPVLRSAVYDVFQAFDFADPSTMNGKRPSTTVAPQALFMMNSDTMQRTSRALAERLLGEVDLGGAMADDAARLVLAYSRAFGRPPIENETSRCREFVASYQVELQAQGIEPRESRIRAWQALCRVLLSSNEFIYLD